jgi:hypothetical protein
MKNYRLPDPPEGGTGTPPDPTHPTPPETEDEE